MTTGEYFLDSPFSFWWWRYLIALLSKVISMAGERSVPAVTLVNIIGPEFPLNLTGLQDDLRAFHTRTFGSDASPGSLPVHNFAHRQGDAHEDDDGLGFYADGAKRTLTDDQIAMFRSSEIYAIRRAREIAIENGEPMPQLGAEGSASLVSATDQSSSRGAKLGQSEPEEAMHKSKRGRQQDPDARSQRSRQFGDGDVPSRRVIRQLDDVQSEDHILDY